MSFSPLDMQVNIAQMDVVGKDYLRIYNASRHEQHYHGTQIEERSKEIDSKVLDLPEELSEYQNIDPDQHQRQRQKTAHKYDYTSSEEENKKNSFYQETEKGHFIDVRR